MKGIFYSAIVMMLIAPIVMYIILYMNTTETQLEEISIKLRGDSMAAYARSINQDLPRVLEISSKRSIGATIGYIDMNEASLDNAVEQLREMMLNGTLYGSEFGLLGPGSVKNWAEAIEAKGHLYGFSTNVTVLDLNVTPYDSFHILLTALILVNISDNQGMMVERVYTEEIPISIEGFNDPLYGLETNGYLNRKFARVDPINGSTELNAAVGNELYMNSTDGASFFDRLEGSLTTSAKYSSMTSNQIGLETIVDLSDFSAVGLSIKPSQTTVDYLYFDSSSHLGYPVNGSSFGWLKIDPEHANIYNVDLIT